MRFKKGYILWVILIILIALSCWYLGLTLQEYLNMVNAENWGNETAEVPVTEKERLAVSKYTENEEKREAQKKTSELVSARILIKGLRHDDYLELLRVIKEHDVFFSLKEDLSTENQEMVTIPDDEPAEERVLIEDGVEIEEPVREAIPADPPENISVIPSEPAVQIPESPVQIPSFSLLALSVMEDTPRALILNRDTGRSYIVKPGDTIEGYQVKWIEEEGVTLSGYGLEFKVIFEDF